MLRKRSCEAPPGGFCDQLFGGQTEWRKGITRGWQVCCLLQHDKRLLDCRLNRKHLLFLFSTANELERFRGSKSW